MNEKTNVDIKEVINFFVSNLDIDKVKELTDELENNTDLDLHSLNFNHLDTIVTRFEKSICNFVSDLDVDELEEVVKRVSSKFTEIVDEIVKLDRMYSVVISRSRADEIVVLVTDVTRISELERKMADQTAMADIGAASAGISHEMGNTLCALSGFVDLLTRGHSDARTQNIISEVKREVDSAQDLINSFGSLARSPEPVTADLDKDDILSIF